MSEKKIDDGGNAFPDLSERYAQGMSLRDWFAGQTLRKFSFDTEKLSKMTASGVDNVFKLMAKISYLSADAMVAEKRRTENERTEMD